RSTVTNTAPNFVRGSVILINSLFFLFATKLELGAIWANIIIGVLIMGLAFWALRNLKETFHTDLDYLEE
ncbi:MAG: MFS transporter, partial [Flavobacteriales bacterium]